MWAHADDWEFEMPTSKPETPDEDGDVKSECSGGFLMT